MRPTQCIKTKGKKMSKKNNTNKTAKAVASGKEIKDKDGNWYAVGKDGKKYLICNRRDIARLEKAASAK